MTAASRFAPVAPVKASQMAAPSAAGEASFETDQNSTGSTDMRMKVLSCLHVLRVFDESVSFSEPSFMFTATIILIVWLNFKGTVSRVCQCL